MSCHYAYVCICSLFSLCVCLSSHCFLLFYLRYVFIATGAIQIADVPCAVRSPHKSTLPHSPPPSAIRRCQAHSPIFPPPRQPLSIDLKKCY